MHDNMPLTLNLFNLSCSELNNDYLTNSVLAPNEESELNKSNVIYILIFTLFSYNK